MKKRNKLFVSLLASLALTGPVLPVANAQANPTEVLTKIDEVGKTAKSVHGAGFLSVAITNQGQTADIGQLNFDVKVNGEEPISLAFLGEVISPFTGGEQLAIETYLKDNVMTLIAPGNVSQQDITDELTEIKADFEGESTPANPEQTLKVMNLTENDTHYVLSLKEDLDVDALWEEATKGMDINQVKEQYIKQMEAQGVEVDEATLAMLDKVYNKEFIKSLLAALNPKVEVHYAKDTYFLTTFKAEFNITSADLVALAAELDPELSLDATELPENIVLKFEGNFDGHGQPQEITVPEVTVTPAAQ
ncbi:MAG: hypothetical protein Q4B80_00480 [Aerococcaceae bacterium]|nr:hypothetical protein [Aerococcaceae bacterium]